MQIEVFAGNFLTLTQSVVTNPKILVVTQTLSLSQDVTKNIRTRAIEHLFKMNDQATVRTSVKNITVAQTLGLSQRSQKTPIVLEAFDFFFPYHTASAGRGGDAASILRLTQTVSVFKPTPARNTLALTQAVGLRIVRHLIVAQTFVLRNKANYFIYDVNRQVAINYPPQTPSQTVRFVYNGYTLEIPAPDFGNTLKLEFSRVSQKTRGNDSIIFRPDIWPRSRILTLAFSYLTRVQAQQFKYLLSVSLGRELDYYDHIGRQWRGVILTPGAAVQETMRNVCSVQIEFQGERQ